MAKMSKSVIPYTDVKSKVQSYVRNLWQENWNKQTDNKLFQIRPNLTEILLPAAGNRMKETVLCRLRTGHTSYTHSYLLKNEEAPWCIPCDEPLSIRHLLLDCWDLYDVRRKHYTADSLKELFRDVPPDAIFQFLQEINRFHFM